MDNKAYLDEIAVKGKKKFSAGPLLTPLMIKLIIVGVFAVIAMMIVGNMLSDSNKKVAEIHEAVYTRVNSLVNPNGPIELYNRKVKSSALHTYTMSLISTLTTTKARLSAVASAINLDPANITPDVTAADQANLFTYNSELEEAYLNGVLDITYATSTAYQISLLISLENQARSKTSDANYAKVLDDSIRDLTVIQENFKNYSDTH